MKVLIRDKNTGHYFQRQGCWVAGPDTAADFETSLAALTFCDEQSFEHVEIVLRFGERDYDIRLPIALHRMTI